MDYQTLSDILGQSKAGVTPAPSLSNIIEGIQSQYQAAPSMPVQSGLYGANRFVSNAPQFGVIEKMPEYGALSQAAGPSFVPSKFDLSAYQNIDDKALSNLIGQIGGSDSGGYSGTPVGIPVDDAGLATASNISPLGVTAGATVLGMMTGLPFGLLSSIVGKDKIATALNNASYAQALAQNINTVAGQMGLDPKDPANSAAISSAIDSLSSLPVGQSFATPGVSGTGGSAAASAQSAASAAQAAGHSDAAIGAASQAAANAAIAGATPAQQAQAGQNAAASVDGGTTGQGAATGIGVGSTTGINAMDAQSDAASSGKIVCTAMNESYGFGSFRNRIWLKYAADNLTKAHEVGYHTLFLPLVDLAYKKNFKPLRAVLENIARHRSADLRAEMRGTKRDNIGRVYRAILEPICYFVGKLKGY